MKKKSMITIRRKSLLLLALLLLTACSTTPGKKVVGVPVLDSFSLNGREMQSSYGPIISQPGKLQFVAKASTGSALRSITIERQKHGQNTELLTTCVVSPCDYEWVVGSSDNGVYSFFVSIVDEDDLLLKVPFKDALSIAIESASVR